MEGTMSSLLAAPSETVSPAQESPWYLGQRKRPDFVYPARPNAAIDPIVGADSNAAVHDINRLFVSVGESLENLTLDAVVEIDRLLRRLTEGMADAPHRDVFIPTRMANLALIAPIETLADRSRAAVDELTRLDPGWDGYHGIAVLPGVAEHALRLLEAIGAHTQIVPDVVPLSNGGLQLEWYVGIHEIEVEIAPNCETRLYFECTADGHTDEIPIDDSLDLSGVVSVFRELLR